jgi:hypothetical protein
MVDLVDAGRDVPLQDPLIGAGGQVVDLGHGVLGAAAGAKAVGAGRKVRLEDRLEHEFQGGLDRPVACGGDPKSPQLASFLGDQTFPHGHRPEPSSLEVDAQLGEERLAAAADRARHDAVHAGRPGSPVAPHPPPCSDQEGGITDKVVEIIEPAIGVVGCPSVQLGLDPQYPRLRLLGRRPRRTDIHRRPPGMPAPPLRTSCRPLPCGRLSRPRTTTSAPSHPEAIG